MSQMNQQPSTSTSASNSTNSATSTTSTKAATQKYRPVLTSAQILHILQLAKTEQPAISGASISLISVLAPFQAKIENAGIQAAYTTSPRKSTTNLNALGATSIATTGTIADSTDYSGGLPSELLVSSADIVGKEVHWEQCYNKFVAQPTSCSLAEIDAAREYMYINDLMSEQEQADFESEASNLGVR